MMMKQIDNYSQIVSWAKLWFHGPEKKTCQENQIREMDVRSRRYFHDTLQQKQEQQLVLQLTFQKFKFFKMPTLRHLIQIQNVWKRLNQTTTNMDQLLLIQHRKLSKKKIIHQYQKRKSFASSTIVYTHINQNQNHVLIQILPIEHQLLLQKEELVEDDDDNIPLGSLLKS